MRLLINDWIKSNPCWQQGPLGIWTYLYPVMNPAIFLFHGPLAWYVKLRVAYAPEIPRTFFPSPRTSDPDMHHGTCVARAPWCMHVSLISDFLEVGGGGLRSRQYRRMRNPQIYVSGKRPMWATSHRNAMVLYNMYQCVNAWTVFHILHFNTSYSPIRTTIQNELEL